MSCPKILSENSYTPIELSETHRELLAYLVKYGSITTVQGPARHWPLVDLYQAGLIMRCEYNVARFSRPCEWLHITEWRLTDQGTHFVEELGPMDAT